MVLLVVGFLSWESLVQQDGPSEGNEDSATGASTRIIDPGEPTGRPGRALNSGWEVVNPETVDELPAYKEVVPGRVLVRILDTVHDWKAGDEIHLRIPQLGADFEGVIERADQDANGNRTYLGHVYEQDGRAHRLVVTAGPRNTFAHIGTSRGTFELVATGGQLGWLMPTANMDQHVDYSRPDYEIEDERRLPGR